MVASWLGFVVAPLITLDSSISIKQFPFVSCGCCCLGYFLLFFLFCFVWFGLVAVVLLVAAPYAVIKSICKFSIAEVSLLLFPYRVTFSCFEVLHRASEPGARPVLSTLSTSVWFHSLEIWFGSRSLFLFLILSVKVCRAQPALPLKLLLLLPVLVPSSGVTLSSFLLSFSRYIQLKKKKSILCNASQKWKTKQRTQRARSHLMVLLSIILKTGSSSLFFALSFASTNEWKGKCSAAAAPLFLQHCQLSWLNFMCVSVCALLFRFLLHCKFSLYTALFLHAKLICNSIAFAAVAVAAVVVIVGRSMFN